MKFKLLAASVALLITQTALANGHINPTSCPTVDAFKNTGVSSVMRDKDGTWVTIEWKNRFGTDAEWTFGVGNITADSQSDALAKGNAAIAGLVYKSGPVQMGSEEMWACIYQDSNSAAFGITVTPALTPEINKVVKLMHIK